MSTALTVVLVAIFAALIIVVIKQHRPELAMALSLLVGVLIFLQFVGKIGEVFSLFGKLADRANINLLHVNTVLKIIGIAYIAEFGAQICRDAGEGAIAGKIEFGAKILVLMLAIPIIVAIMDTLMRMLP